MARKLAPATVITEKRAENPPTLSVWAWGLNFFGEVGDGSTLKRLSPVPVSGLSGVTAIAARSTVSMALKSDGSVWYWGHNGAAVPAQKNDVSGVTAIAAGGNGGSFYLVLNGNGTVSAWGSNSNG